MPGKESSEPGSRRRGRMHDAEGAREAILDAGEAVFAEHGFDGARIDAIAEAAGYNKSLIFQYFGDKLGLYAAVNRRADEQTRVWQSEALADLADQAAVQPDQIRNLLRKYVGQYFDYLVDHPYILRIFNWELAEGWQTFSKILTERDYDDVVQFRPIFARLQKAGLVRVKPNIFLQYTSALFMCHAFLGILPLYRVLLPDADLESRAAMAQAREFLVEFIANGLLLPPSSKTKR